MAKLVEKPKQRTLGLISFSRKFGLKNCFVVFQKKESMVKYESSKCSFNENIINAYEKQVTSTRDALKMLLFW